MGFGLVVLTLAAAFLHVVQSVGQIITTEPGENIILPCRSDDSRTVTVVEWSRTDLDLEPDFVLLFKDDQIYPDGQLPSYKNRVNLQDRQMKDGDLSLILNNVTINDTGTYECRVVQREGSRKKIKISTIQLQVSPPGDKRGQTGDKEGQDGGDQDETSAGSSGLIAALVVLTVIVALIPVVIIIVKRRRPLYHPPPHNEAEKPRPV